MIDNRYNKWGGKIRYVPSFTKEDQIMPLKYHALGYEVKRFHEQKMHVLKLLPPTLTGNKHLRVWLSEAFYQIPVRNLKQL